MTAADPQARTGRRILIDGMAARGGGGFTYLVNMLPRLAAIAPSEHFRALVSSEPLARAIAPSANLEVDLHPPSSWPERVRYTLVDAPRLARSWRADLYFSASEFAPPRAPCPTIASFRNPNVYTALDQGWGWKQRLRMRVLRGVSRLAARTCDRIVFVSEDSARWIGDAVGVPVGRRAVVHHGIDADAWRHRAAGTTSLPSGSGPYVLSVSSVYRYKNYVRLIEAWTLLARRRAEVPDLLIVGDDQDPEYSAQMRRTREAAGALAARIHVVGEVPHGDIADYYARARLFVFPSYLETFGHPLLEALASGVPSVASDIPVFREVAGDAALFADPHDAASLAAAMEQALFTERTREVLAERGRDRAHELSWDCSARKLYELFEDVLAAPA